MRRERVSFVSGGDVCAGYLFIPEAAADTGTRWPCVVLAHGFSGTMDRLLPHAERFATDGIAALVFDYRGFGESGGEPRQIVDLPSQQQDLRAAIAWIRGRDDLDPSRVALWGNGFPRVRNRSTTAALRLLAAILWDALRGKLGLSPAYIPMIGKPGQVAVISTTEAQRHLTTLAGEAGATLWRNQVAPRGLLQMLRYRPALDAARLRAALLVCVAIDDTESPEAMTRELADRAPHGTLLRYPGTHFDFYTDPSVRERALADQLGFLHERLQISPRVG
jgi:fermentation-respiration switch protein FrsA (DUF1100 family)